MEPVLLADDDAGRLLFAALADVADVRLVPPARLAAAARDAPGARFLGAGELPDGERSREVDRAALLADAPAELAAICAWLGVEYDAALLAPLEIARRGAAAAAEAEAAATAALGSRYTASFASLIEATGGSLLVSTYQAGRLVVLRSRDGVLNTHFRSVDKPMGMAVGTGGRLAVGTRTEIWDLRDVPAAAAKVEAEGEHDACLILRNRHVTGDVAIHDLGFDAEGQLWGVLTAFSCLATFDTESSFVPRWRPPWISGLQPGDRCHLNGLAMREGRPAHATALGTGDEPGSWRAGKASGGVLLDIASGETVLSGLSMPHSPRWADDRLYLLESGEGRLGVADLDAGTVEPICELPGFTRGMVVTGDVAWVGLSQIRESSSFADLPITHRLKDRQSGVWAVNLQTGEVIAFLRFEDLVQEVFEVALWPGARWPELAEPAARETALTYVLPGA